MNIKKKLQDAYDNILLFSNGAWTSYHNDYQKLNLKLVQAEQQINSSEFKQFRPRNVRDAIPRSKLAQYSNYPYNESRELSYNPIVLIYPYQQYKKLSVKELWELPEIDNLFEIFSQCPTERNVVKEETESLFLKANSLEEEILKVRIAADKIQNIWKKDSYKKSEIILNFYKSPFGNYFVNESNLINEPYQICNEFEQLKKLSNHLNEQNELILKLSNINEDECKKTSKDVLYSEVLQGLTLNKKLHSFTTTNYPILTSCMHQTYFYSAETFGIGYNQNFTINRQLQRIPLINLWLSQDPINLINQQPLPIIEVIKSTSGELQTQALEQYHNLDEGIYNESEETKQQYDCN